MGARLSEPNLELQRLLQKQVGTLEAKHGDDFAERVRRLFRSAVLTDQAGASQVAALFSMPTTLLDEVSLETAKKMLENTSLDVETIAEALGYARASAF